ncbi:MAG: diaminopimelate decarboxylase [Alphaproteobacteria bacterium]
MAGITEKNNRVCIDDIPLADIAGEYGTPCYVYSASVIRGQYNALKNAMGKALPSDKQPLLCYACKANTNIALLKLLQTLGSGLEIVSEGELAKGLKAGFSGDQIISTSFGKVDAEIKACLNAGIHQLNIESVPELYHVDKVAGEMDKTAQVVFRLNPNVTGGGHHKISTGRKRDKFGLSAERILDIYKIAQELDHIEPVGLSVHIGSQVSNVAAFKPAFEKLADMVKTLRAQGYSVERLDIGGGFPIIYNDEKLLDLEEYANWVRDIILPLDVEIQMEPGRYMVGNAGILLSQATYIKETGERDFLVLDAGMNDLIRPTLYEAYHKIGPLDNLDRPQKTYDVVGPICESGDIFAENRNMPEIKGGEYAGIYSAGAYGFAMASNYNTRPLPPEILVDGDKISIIRQRQTIQDIMKDETIPDWLDE